jgi:hypothetical protein
VAIAFDLGDVVLAFMTFDNLWQVCIFIYLPSYNNHYLQELKPTWLPHKPYQFVNILTDFDQWLELLVEWASTNWSCRATIFQAIRSRNHSTSGGDEEDAPADYFFDTSKNQPFAGAGVYCASIILLLAGK